MDVLINALPTERVPFNSYQKTGGKNKIKRTVFPTATRRDFLRGDDGRPLVAMTLIIESN